MRSLPMEAPEEGERAALLEGNTEIDQLLAQLQRDNEAMAGAIRQMQAQQHPARQSNWCGVALTVLLCVATVVISMLTWIGQADIAPAEVCGTEAGFAKQSSPLSQQGAVRIATMVSTCSNGKT